MAQDRTRIRKTYSFFRPPPIYASGGGGGGGGGGCCNPELWFSTQDDAIFTTGSVLIRGPESENAAEDYGSDVFFYVSGSIGSTGPERHVSVFGGDVVTSGSLTAFNGLSGSLTQLPDGTSYLIAGVGIDIVSASNGAVTISSQVGGGDVYTDEFYQEDLVSNLLTVPHGLNAQYVDVSVYDENDKLIIPDEVIATGIGTVTIDLSSFTPIPAIASTTPWHVFVVSGQAPIYTDVFWFSTTAGSIYTSGSVAIVGAGDEYGVIDSPLDKGADVFFYVSGSISGSGVEDRKALFGGDVRISGSLTVGTGSIIVTSNNVQFTGYDMRLERDGADMMFYDPNYPTGLSLTDLYLNGGTPGSPVNSVQYNSAGTFAGSANFTYDGRLYLTGAFSQGDGSVAGGLDAHAEGRLTTGIGNYSHAEGNRTRAEGIGAHAEGYLTTGSADYSHSEGAGTIAAGDAAHAEGLLTTASAYYSHAEGYGSLTSRAGSISVGRYSHAEGVYTRTWAEGAHAEGNRTFANGLGSHTEGLFTTASAGADYSHAEGWLTLAEGDYSHVEGVGTRTTGQGSHAEGHLTTGSGQYSHAEGHLTFTQANYSHVEGGSSFVNAASTYSHAEGFGTLVSNAQYAHAEGLLTTASANVAHAEGNRTLASGVGSHAEGYLTTGSGDYSHAEGWQTLVEGDYSHAEGRLTRTNTDYSHVEGYLTTASVNAVGAHAEGYSTWVRAYYAHTEGYETTVTDSGQGSHAEGYHTRVQGATYAHAEGGYTLILSTGAWAHAEGYLTTGSGIGSHAEGYLAKSVGNYSHAEGYDTESRNLYSHAEGGSTLASADYSHAEGVATVTEGEGSHAEGFRTVAVGDYSHAGGLYTIADDDFQTVIGKYNVGYTDAEREALFIVGDGTDDTLTLRHTFLMINSSSKPAEGTVMLLDKDECVVDASVNSYALAISNTIGKSPTQLSIWGIGQDVGERLVFSYGTNTTSDPFSVALSPKGYLDDAVNVSNIDFTGQHRSVPVGQYEQYNDKVGRIVTSAGTYVPLSGSTITINDAVPRVELSIQRNDKRCFGVISDSEDVNSSMREYKQGRFVSVYEKNSSDDNRLFINSLGEGCIWVCNINGNLENGDYITTCEVPGYGMKQDDDLLHNYTVAKITCDCDFDLNSAIYRCEEFTHEGVTYKRAFVGCTYHCG